MFLLVEEVKKQETSAAKKRENKKQFDGYGMLGVLFSSIKILKGMQVAPL